MSVLVPRAICRKTVGLSLNRAAGRVIENPLVSVTTDPLMQTHQVSGPAVATGKNGVDEKTGDHSLSANVSPQRIRVRARAPTFFSTPFSQSTPLVLKFGEHFMGRSVVTLTKGYPVTLPLALSMFGL